MRFIQYGRRRVAVPLVLSVLSISVMAMAVVAVLASGAGDTDAATVAHTGSCGTDATWTIDTDGNLVITGSGSMVNFDYDTTPADRWGDVDVKTVTVTGSITSIGESAFKGCSKLTSVTLPDSLTRIEGFAFRDCTGLKSIEFPSKLESIGGYAFAACPLTKVEIPDLVKTIGIYAFGDNKSLSTLILGKNVESVGEAAFVHCTMARIEFGDSLKTIGMNAFKDCQSLTSVDIPDSVTYIGNGAFNSCRNLKSVTIPDSVKTIEDYAFESCSALTSIDIPDSVTNMGGYAFAYCTALTTMSLPGTIEKIPRGLFDGCTALTSVTIPTSVRIIGEYAFNYCLAMKSVAIPASVKSIGDNAFTRCDAMTGFTVDKSNTAFCAVDGILFNKDMSKLIVYPSAKTGSEYVVPSTVKSIGVWAFNNCSLESISLPDSLTAIGEYAFCGCTHMTSIAIPGSVTSFGDNMFGWYAGPTEISFGKGLADLGDAFTYSGYSFYDEEGSTRLDTKNVADFAGYTFKGDGTWDDVWMTGEFKMIRQEKAIIVTFDANQGTCPVAEMKVDAEGKLSRLPTAAREGHSFIGWFTAASGGDRIDETSVFDSDATVYAQWKEEFEIVFDAAGGQCPVGSLWTVDGKLPSMPAPTYRYRDFDGWFTAGSGGTEVTLESEFSGSATVYAHWTEQPGHTIAFDPNGGACSTAEMRTDADGMLPSLPVPGYAYRDFDGWYTSASGGGRVDGSTAFGEDSTVYAHWSVCRVSYDHGMLAEAAGGQGAVGGLSDGGIFSEGSRYEQLPDTAGYRHVGWIVDGERIAPTAEIRLTVSHVAQSVWTELQPSVPPIDWEVEDPVIPDGPADESRDDRAVNAAVAAGCVAVLLAIIVLVAGPRIKD